MDSSTCFEKGVEVTISKSKNEDAMNMSDEDTNDQFDDQVNELLAQTLDGEDNLEELFEQRQQQKKLNNRQIINELINVLT